MPVSRVVRWGAAAVLVVAVTTFVYAGAVAAHASSDPHASYAGPTYNVTFNETGLPAGTNWTVSVFWHGGWMHFPLRGHHETSNGPTLVFSLPNGTYRYLVHPVAGFLVEGGGHGLVRVAGASPPTVNVTFARLTTYAVTFSESGLASGTNWTVRVVPAEVAWHHEGGRGTVTGNGASLTLSLPNGTYAFCVLPVPGYEVTANGSGTFSVSGASPPAVQVTFVRLTTYTVTFQETGLPSGTNWSVAVGALPSWGGSPAPTVVRIAMSNTSTITFQLPNGTYLFHVGHVDGYFVQNGSFGVVNVSGAAPPTINVTFVAFGTCPPAPATLPGVGTPSGPARALVAAA
jgi:hypothetical protein